MSGQLGAPMEFDEAVAAPAPALTVAERPRLLVTTEIPKKQIGIVTGGNRRITVFMVDKAAAFVAPSEQLRARWHDVVVRPTSGRVVVYDGKGVIIARFDDLAQAQAAFKQAGILDAVNTKLKAIKVKRDKDEKVARERLEAQRAK